MQHRILKKIYLIIPLVTIVLSISWVGFIASDDAIYLSAANAWLDDFPQVGKSHWGNRYPFILTSAGFIFTFGSSELTFIAANLVFFGLLLGVSYFGMSHYFGHGIPEFCLVLMVMTPLLAVYATIPGVDISESALVFSSFWLFVGSLRHKKKTGRLLAAGSVLGIAVLNRLTALGLMVFFGLLFLFSIYIKRKFYFLVAAGFGMILGLDALYHWVSTGEPLHRFNTALTTHRGLDEILAFSDYDVGTGNISHSQILGPITAILFNQEFGLLYFFALPASYMLLRSKDLDRQQHNVVGLLVLLMVVWFVWIGYSHAVRPLPRYFAVSTVCASLLVGIWLWGHVRYFSRKLAILVAAILISSYAAGILVENKNPQFAARVLAEIVAGRREPIYTDPNTASLARQYVVWAGSNPEKLVYTDPPPRGALFFYNRKGVDKARTVTGRSFVPSQYQPKPSWVQVARFEDSRLAKVILDIVIAHRWLPEEIYLKVAQPNPSVILYRVGKDLTE